ncbi:MAG: hypothetical protein DA328_00645 [Nitrososphaeraceae archaeon]|nr:hypothetical protein [Nitrososphaeraceae archaeon]
MQRENISNNSSREDVIGFSRMVKVGPHVFISGTSAIDNTGNIVGVNDPYEQTRQIILNIKKGMERINAGLENIVRTRIYLVSMNDWKKVAKAHSEFFGDIRPATTILEIKHLMRSEMLVEMEADAIVET